MQPKMTHDDGDMIRRRYNNATDDGGGGSINCNNVIGRIHVPDPTADAVDSRVGSR